MFAFDRDTATLVAIAVCIAASLYLYKELKKTKEDMESLKSRPVASPGVFSAKNAPVEPKSMTQRKKVTIVDEEPAEEESEK